MKTIVEETVGENPGNRCMERKLGTYRNMRVPLLRSLCEIQFSWRVFKRKFFTALRFYGRMFYTGFRLCGSQSAKQQLGPAAAGDMGSDE